MSTHLTAAVPVPAIDELPIEVRLLLGDGMREVLDAMVAPAGAHVLAWRARELTHRPGSSTVARYRTELGWPSGTRSSQTFVAATGNRPLEGAAAFELAGRPVSVWRWSSDPALPGLGCALDACRAGTVLHDLGIRAGALRVRARTYRPGRRAVVEVTGERERFFLKIVPPARAEGLHEHHRMLAAHLAVPESRGWTPQGVVVLAALPGSTLREALRSGRQDLPPPAAVTGVLDRLPAALLEAPRRRDLRSAAKHHAAVLAATVPAARSRVDDLLDQLGGDGPTGGSDLPVHGDLHDAQLLVEGRRVTGLLDVDTAGRGSRADDLANLCAHLSVLALRAADPASIRRWEAALLAHAERDHDVADLRQRTAAAVIGLATGPFRLLEPDWPQRTIDRLEIARRWLAAGPDVHG